MKRGFSLLELILALLLLQVGLLAAAGMIHLSQVNVRRAELMVRAVLEAEWIGDSILASGSMTPGVAAFPWGEVHWSPLSSPLPALRITAWSEAEADTLVTLLALARLSTGLPGSISSPSPTTPPPPPESE